MSGSQLLLVIGGLILFSLLAVNVNKSIANSDLQTSNSEYISTATSLGQSVINKINTKAFDQGTIGDPVFDPTKMTPANLLGHESGETPATYNDVDDYNNFTEADTTPRAGVFNILVHVNYVDDNNPKTILTSSTSRTKRIQVAISNQFMKDTLYMYSYKCY
ncbi:MAG: hypothetical protein M1480_02025 [Bacteroidetes bacterium]|nr:hypothetical protein [Bacteroidota bacterium]